MPARAEGQVPRLMNQLDNEIRKTAEMLGELRARFEPVLRPDSVPSGHKTKEESRVAETLVPAACRIQSQIEAVHLLQVSLGDILEREQIS